MNAIGAEITNLETNDKTIVGAVNENKNHIIKKQDKIDDLKNEIFKDKKEKENTIELLSNAFYLAETLFDENEFYGTNDEHELGNKIHLNTDGIVRILKNTNITELTTFYKNVIDAINELKEEIKDKKISNGYFK